MAELQNKQYAIPDSGKEAKEVEVTPELIADIDEILAEAYAEYGEIDIRLAEAVRTGTKIQNIHDYVLEHPELVDV